MITIKITILQASNTCSPGSHIMSPTLGSGKITWSECSRAYLRRFGILLTILKWLIF